MKNIQSIINTWTPRRRTLLLASAAAFAATHVHAQSSAYPTRPIRIVVPSPAGSLADVIARLLAPAMSEQLTQPIVIDNRAGAGGSLAGDHISKATPDGYSLLLATDSLLAINPFIYPNLPYDSRKDFQPISLLGMASVVMVVNPNLGVKTLAELIELAKAKPGSLNYGSGGIGHTTHLAMELFLNRAQIEMTHVAYRGTAPALQGMLGNETSVMITGLAEALPQINSGKLVALATSGPMGQSLLPNLPELKEVHPDLAFAFWFALMAPVKTSTEVIATIQAAVAQAASSADARKRLGDYGFTLMSSLPATVKQMLADDLSKYGSIVNTLGIKVE